MMTRMLLATSLGFGLVIAGANAQTGTSNNTVEDIIRTIQREFPDAGVRITGRARTVERQAELMSAQLRADPNTFNRTYRAAPHITEMNQWVQDNPNATTQAATSAFSDIINRARANGARVSNHLSDTARDVSWPQADAATQQAIEARLRELGGRVIQEPTAKGGKHWHIDYDDNAKKAPAAPNTGPYQRLAEDDRKLVPLDAPRSQRIQQLQQISPLRSGFGGILLGNNPKKAPQVRKADFDVDQGRVKLRVQVEGQDSDFSYSDMTMTELWCAYHFLRPDQEERALGAAAGDLGLVGIQRNRINENGSWDFGVHPAIANTHLALDAMRVDMSLTLGDPRLPKLPTGWATYRWIDEPAEITARNGAIQLRPAAGPRNFFLRVTLWGKEKQVPGDTIPFVIELYKRFDGLRQLDRFARVVALLNWLDAAGKLPTLPSSVQPRKVDQPNTCFLSQVAFTGGEITRHELAAGDQLGRVRPGCLSKTHVVFLEEGQDVVIDMYSGHFDAYLRLEDPRGRKLAEDDDGAGGLNARIVYRAREAGAYRVVATTFQAGKTGAYHLQIWDSPSPATWIGKTVFLKRAGIQIGHTDDSGKETYVGRLTRPDYVVLDERDGWIQVEQANARGWFDKNEAVVFELALGHFGQTLQKGDANAWALACRGAVREHRGDLQAALQDFESAARLNPDAWSAARDRMRNSLTD